MWKSATTQFETIADSKIVLGLGSTDLFGAPSAWAKIEVKRGIHHFLMAVST